jgi:hypothetical protein
MISSPIQVLTPVVQAFISHLQSKFPEQFANEQTASTFKETVVDCLKSNFPLRRRPGRPRQNTVTRATELRHQRKDWGAIFADPIIHAALIKPFESQPASSRTYAENQNAKFDLSVAKSRLRSAVRVRLKRKRRRLSDRRDSCPANKLF